MRYDQQSDIAFFQISFFHSLFIQINYFGTNGCRLTSRFFYELPPIETVFISCEIYDTYILQIDEQQN